MYATRTITDGDFSTFFPASAWFWRIKWQLCALLLLKWSSRMGSATFWPIRRIIWHLKSIERGWEASCAAVAFAGTHNQRTQMQSALLYASLNSNCCNCALQSPGTKKSVCADQSWRLLLAISGLWDYNILILCACAASLGIALLEQES